MSTSDQPELAQWQHLHPLSPILRGGLVGVGVLGYAASQLLDNLFASVSGSGSAPGQDEGWSAGLGLLRDHPLLAAAAVLVALAVVGGFGWLSWRFAKFRVAEGQIEFRKGWLFREHRQVPLERVQAVEISRPLLAQLTGLSQVLVQSAGGGDSQLKLAFLGAERADEVRSELLVLAGRHDEVRAGADDLEVGAGGVDAGGVAGIDGEGAREVLRVPNGRLFVATILHGSTLVLGLVALVGGAVALAVYGSTLQALTGAVIALPALGPLALGVALNRGRELLKHGNFRLAHTPTSARIQHGLTDKRTTTIPIHRIQALGMVQPLWWRPLGWWRVRVNVAGIASDPSGNDEETTVLPVGTLEQAMAVLTLLDPRVSPEMLHRAALEDGTDGGWTLVSERARVLDWLSWRRSGFAVSEHSLMHRTGRLTRGVVIVPHARVQSLTLAQGPLERRLGLAALALVSTEGPVHARIGHLDTEVATRLLHDESARARSARQMSRTACGPHDVPSQLGDPSPPDER